MSREEHFEGYLSAVFTAAQARKEQPRVCGAPAVGGTCVLPAGHNMGRVDIPEYHSAHPNEPTHWSLIAGWGDVISLSLSDYPRADTLGKLQVSQGGKNHAVVYLTVPEMRRLAKRLKKVAKQSQALTQHYWRH